MCREWISRIGQAIYKVNWKSSDKVVIKMVKMLLCIATEMLYESLYLKNNYSTLNKVIFAYLKLPFVSVLQSCWLFRDCVINCICCIYDFFRILWITWIAISSVEIFSYQLLKIILLRITYYLVVLLLMRQHRNFHP